MQIIRELDDLWRLMMKHGDAQISIEQDPKTKIVEVHLAVRCGEVLLSASMKFDNDENHISYTTYAIQRMFDQMETAAAEIKNNGDEHERQSMGGCGSDGSGEGHGEGSAC